MHMSAVVSRGHVWSLPPSLRVAPSKLALFLRKSRQEKTNRTLEEFWDSGMEQFVIF